MVISYRVLDGSFAAAYASLVSHAILDEPMSRGLGLNQPEELTHFVTILLPCLDSGLTVGAVDEDTGELVGCRSTVIKKLSEVHEHHFDFTKPDEKKIATILMFDDFVQNGVDVFRETGADELVHFYGLFVEKAYRRQGIARRLVEEAIQLAKGKGFRGIRAEASSNFSRKIFDALGFRQLKSVSYNRFLIDGEIVFRDIYPHENFSIHCLNI